MEQRTTILEVSISEIANDAKAGKIEKISVDNNAVEVLLKAEEGKEALKKTTTKESEAGITEVLTYYGVTADQLSSINIEILKPSGFLFWTANILPFLLPIIFIGLLIWYLSRQMKGASMQAFTFGQSRARMSDPKDGKQKVTFKDVAGVKEAKVELMEIVDFLKNPKKFLDIGARIPKGVLLMGSPGTGKTLLARAVAGEAGVAFFSISGSEFVEMFVGVGASRVRDLFKAAKDNAPAIIFIDEIDAVGRSRGVGIGGGNDEREQTLNQILVEMDGFEPNEKVIVMAATNRPDVLDPAILRPGRFDRRVMIDLPDRNDRLEILKIHARGKPLAEDVDLDLIAHRTPGFSGADLYSLVNESAILAAREERKSVAQFDLIRSIEKVMLGPERRSHLITGKEREIVAYHEAGHALVSSVLPNADPVHKISIISRGRSGGYTMKLPELEKSLHSRAEFIDDIAMTFGGYAAEMIVFGDVTTGPSNDLQVASMLARSMVTRYGMSEAIGPVALESEGRTISGAPGVDGKDFSEKISSEVDGEIRRIVETGLKTATDVLNDKRNVLDAIAKRLLEVEVLERDDYEQILIAHGISIRPRAKMNLSEGVPQV
ncbi:MAG: ATP-dependent zinc metalloprotease FtsH [Candidatus Pacebacteria bacterium]|nr:ATP-dependent zinc metalloprotease FtsH [Candidatus Paceibacterota bacterium]